VCERVCVKECVCSCVCGRERERESVCVKDRQRVCECVRDNVVYWKPMGRSIMISSECVKGWQGGNEVMEERGD